MPYGLYISAEGAHAQSKRMEVLANNLANVDTPGFKRDLTMFQSRYAEETQRGLDSPGSKSINDLGGGIWVRGTATNFAPGAFRRTDLPTDMAISGEGFFVVQKDGREYLTRAGNFRLNETGRLVTQEGDPVMSDAGTPIDIDTTGGPWRVTPDGSILQDGSSTPLAIARPRSLGDLMKVGKNLFSPLAPTERIEPQLRSIAGGTVEQSGVQPTLEMMEVIEASRAFEANMNMIRNHDEMMGTLVNRVLKAS